ncbi:MAG: hypothetical protein U9O87_05790 [Verrucomicrobiota bacterium]|nr:hypothetical protein [Verrucomicrobiota bacterium]
MEHTNIFQKSKWVWEHKERKNSYVGAYKKLLLNSSPEKITISLFADTHYKLYLNGQFVNAGPAPFAKPIIMADTYDITPFLKKGNNDIFIFAHFLGVTVKYNKVDHPGIIASINGICQNKTKVAEYTGVSWQIFPIKAWTENTPKKNWALGFIEEVDLNSSSYAVLQAYATEDYGDPDNKKPPVAEFAKLVETPKCRQLGNLTVRNRIVPYLRWEKEEPMVIKEIFRDNPKVYLLNDTIRLDNEYLQP